MVHKIGAKTALPYIMWPGNVLTFCETAIQLGLRPVRIVCPEESRDLFYYAEILTEKPKYTVLKEPCVVMDGIEFRPCLLEPMNYKKGSNCVYKIVTNYSTYIYTPADEAEFRAIVDYPKNCDIYGFIGKN